MSTPITDYSPRYSKSREDVLFEKFENNLVIIAFTRDRFNPLRNIIYSYQDVGVAKGYRKRSHEVNALDIKKINY